MNTIQTYNPLITVAITTYNRPDTLRQALESVIHQSYKNLEILILDDCSKGIDTQNLIQKFMRIDKRIGYHRHDNNIGVNPNFNFAINNAKGKYFMWLCDDDWIDENYIKLCLDNLIKDNECVLVTGKTKFYWGSKFSHEGIKISLLDNNKDTRWLSFYVNVLGSGNPPNFGLIELGKLRNFTMPNIMGCDYILFSKIAYIGKIKTIEDVFIHRRLGGMSETMKKMAINFSLSAFDRRLSFLSLWVNILRDFFFNSALYNQLSFLKKIYLAFKLNLLVFFNMPEYVRRYKMRRRIRVPIKSWKELFPLFEDHTLYPEDLPL